MPSGPLRACETLSSKRHRRHSGLPCLIPLHMPWLPHRLQSATGSHQQAGQRSGFSSVALFAILRTRPQLPHGRRAFPTRR